MREESSPVAIFLPMLAGGGAERVMLNLANGLVAQGKRVDLVLGRAEGPYLTQVDADVNIVDLAAPRTLRSLPALVQYLNTAAPAVLISALDHANIVSLWANKLARKKTKTVITLHCNFSTDMENSSSKLYKIIFPLFIKRFYGIADSIVSVSTGVAEDYANICSIDKKKIKVIYNPVISDSLYTKAEESVDHPWFLNKKNKIIISVGRLSPQKSYSDLIKAVAKVLETQPVRLMILGEGELRPELEGMIADLKLSEHVLLPGFVDNPYKYLAKSDLFVLSSRWEGLPTVLIEALALGTPVVSTNCKNGPDEILMNGRFGTLVAVGDVDGLALGIQEALKHPRAMADCACCDRFTYEKTIADYTDLIDGLSNG